MKYVLRVVLALCFSTLLFATPKQAEAQEAGWQWIDGHYYYLNSDGTYRTGWIWDDDYNAWFYCEDPGRKVWDSSLNDWVAGNNPGAMYTGWHLITIPEDKEAFWFYFYDNGVMVSNCWAWIDNAWYGFWANGKMCRGWIWDHSYNAWFYCNGSTGVMYQGWHPFNDEIRLAHWYYFYDTGVMVSNCWIDGYWVAENGQSVSCDPVLM